MQAEIIKIYPSDTEEEIELKSKLIELQERYKKEAQPYIERLCDIHALKVPKIFVVPKQQ